jgi:HPt (histidine-containing phosphotransfer) domain-containing protein
MHKLMVKPWGGIAEVIQKLVHLRIAYAKGKIVTMDLALPGAELPVIDENRLMAEFGDMPEILSELRDLFLEHAPPLFEAIVDGVQNRDNEALLKASHSLKGASSTFGAPRLTHTCKEIEAAAKAGDVAAIGAYLEVFTVEYHTVCREISKVGAS